MKMTVKCSFNSTNEHASTTVTVFNKRAMISSQIYHGFEVAVKVHKFIISLVLRSPDIQLFYTEKQLVIYTDQQISGRDDVFLFLYIKSLETSLFSLSHNLLRSLGHHRWL